MRVWKTVAVDEHWVKGRTFMSVVALAGIVSVTNPPARGDDKSIASVAKSYLEKAIASAKGLVSNEEAEEPAGEPASTQDESEIAVLGEAVKRIFLKEGGYHFTQSRWGAKPQPYQIEGLEVYPLDAVPSNDLDTAEGIDRRISYEFRAKAHRVFDAEIGWGRWRPGTPPHLGNITLVRQNGQWKVSVTPEWAYTVK